MTELIPASHNLPANIEDLAKFILVGREKLVSVRAEIRAINKLELAEEVRIQKRNEAQMLSEALLDAEVRIGELLKQIPKDAGGRPCKTYDSGVASFEKSKSTNHDCEQCKSSHPWCDGCCSQCVDPCNSAQSCRRQDNYQKPKLEVVKNLGFTPKQKERFETLASNKDVVEQVKAEARENDDLPTRSRVLRVGSANTGHWFSDDDKCSGELTPEETELLLMKLR